MKHLILSILLLFSTIAAMSQYRYGIEDCWKMAKNNYPAIKVRDLINKSANYTLANASSMKYPQQSDSSQNSSQREVYGVVNTPNASISGDLGANLFILSDRINNIYFSLILLDKKIKLNEILQLQLVDLYKFFATNKNQKVNTSVNIKGVVALQEKSKSDYAKLKELQQIYLNMLSQMIARTVNDKVTLLEPDVRDYLINSGEYSAYELLDNSKTNPFFGKISYTPQSVYTQAGGNYKVFEVAKVTIDNNKAPKYGSQDLKSNLFSANLKKQKDSERAEISKLKRAIEEDRRTIEICKEITMVSFNKVAEGTTNITNLTQNILNFENVHHTLAAHQAQLMMAANKFRFLYD